MLSDKQKALTDLFPVFNMLPEKDLSSIVNSGVFARYPTGSLLSKEDNICPFIPLVLSGTLRIFILSPEGREVTLFYANPGDFCLLGIACRMKTGELPAVVEVQEEAEFFTVPAPVYEAYLEPNAAWNRFLFSTLYQHLYDAMNTFENLMFTRVDQRLAQYLLTQSKNKSHILYVTHEQIAVHLNTAREVVSRLMAELKRRNILTYERGKIHIKDIKALAQLAGGS